MYHYKSNAYLEIISGVTQLFKSSNSVFASVFRGSYEIQRAK